MGIYNQNNGFIVELSAYTSPEIVEKKTEEFISYGEDNNYFQYLIDSYVNSTTNNATINGIVSMIYGKGLDALDSSRKPNQYAKLISLLSKEDLRKIIFDRKTLGLASLQILYTNGEVSKIEHFPVRTLRPQKMDEDGKIKNWLYHPNWTDKKKSDVVKELPVFGSTKQTKAEVFILRPYVSGFEYFPPVDYQGSLPYCYLEEQISDYLINDTINGFSGTKVINFNNGIPKTIKEREEIKDATLSKVTGARGNKVIVGFNKSKETATTVEDIPLNDAPQHYQYLSEEAQSKILKGHKAPLWLLGANSGGNGLSSNADEIKNAMLVFDNLVIKPYQTELIEALDEILAVNDISLKLYFKTIQPLEFVDVAGLDAETKEEETGVKMSALSDKFIDTTIADDLISYADEDLEGWEVVDERDLDYDLEDDLDKEIEALNSTEKEPTVLAKIINLVSTGRANPSKKSEQDRKVKETYFKVRYKYFGNKSPERLFCKKMMSADKLYRKEDVIAMENKIVNAGFGEFGANKYSIWKFKGGARCRHSWRRVTMKSKDKSLDAGNPNAPKVGTRQAERLGYKVTNPYQVSIQPKNLPLKGFSPRNKNLPSDVR